MIIFINDYFVDPIVTHHFETTHSISIPIANSKKLILDPINLPHILMFCSYLIVLQLNILILVFLININMKIFENKIKRNR